MEASNLKIDYFMTTAHAIPHETLTNLVLNSGGISIHIDNRATYVTLNLNNSTLKYQVLEESYTTILQRIKSTFNCTYEEANNLFHAYGNTEKRNIRIDKAIYITQFGNTHNVYRISHLTSLIKEELSKILIKAKLFLDSYSTDKMTICISGVCNTLESLNEFAKLSLGSINVILYKSLNYICKENANIEYIGVLKYIQKYNKNIERNFTSIIHTNPNTLRIFPQVKKDSIFKKLFGKIRLRGSYAQR